MTGGDVSGNCAGNNGGGLFCTATQGAGTVFAISGGTIQDNRAEVGGGLYAAYGRLELTGGFIDGNTASEGGGIAANGTAEGSRMRGGRLTENTAQTGGGLLLADAGQFALLGGEVSANQGAGRRRRRHRPRRHPVQDGRRGHLRQHRGASRRRRV